MQGVVNERRSSLVSASVINLRDHSQSLSFSVCKARELGYAIKYKNIGTIIYCIKII